MKGKKPEIVQKLVNSAVLDPMPGTSKTQEVHYLKTLKDPDSYLKDILPVESISATTDLIKTTPERIRRSWELLPLPENPKLDPGTYLNGLKDPHSFLLNLPETIEDEIPPVSEAFAEKVKAMGGIMTPVGLICDPSIPVVGKRYMRLARALFCVMFSATTRHVEDAEFHIRGYANRNRDKVDWEGTTGYFANCLRLAFKHRHNPGREPVYANKE